MSNTAKKYKPGDRVVGTALFLRGKAGRIDRTGRGVTAMVVWDDKRAPERIDLDAIRSETVEDVAARALAYRMDEWRRTRPDVKIARFEYSGRWLENAATGVVVSARTPAEMRDAAHELMACADWFESKPTIGKP